MTTDHSTIWLQVSLRLLGCLSKFNTSLVCKSVLTFFVSTENEKCIKVFFTVFVEGPRTPYEKCKKRLHFSSAVPTKNIKTAKKVMFYIFRRIRASM